MIKTKNTIITVLLFAILTRLLYLVSILESGFNRLGLDIFIVDESKSYLDFSRNLLACHVMATGPCLPSAFRTPIYPLLLSGLIWLFGDKNGVWAMIIFQLILSILTVFIVYLTMRRIISNTPAIFVAIVYSLILDQITYTFLIATETLFTFLIVICIYFLILYIQQNKTNYLILSGFALGFSILTRPITTYLPVILCVFLLIMSFREKRRIILNPLILLVVPLIVIFPWVFRNFLVFGTADISTVSGTNLYFYNYAYLKAYLSNRSVDDVQTELRSREVDESSVPVRSDFAQVYRQAAFASHEILKYPKEYAIVHGKGLIKIIFGTSSVELFHQYGLNFQPRDIFDIVNHDTFLNFITKIKQYFVEKWIQIAVLVFKVAIFISALLGFIIGFRNKPQRKEIFVLSIIGLYLIIIAGPQPFPRFGIPAWPIICMISGFAFLSNRTNVT